MSSVRYDTPLRLACIEAREYAETLRIPFGVVQLPGVTDHYIVLAAQNVNTYYPEGALLVRMEAGQPPDWFVSVTTPRGG